MSVKRPKKSHIGKRWDADDPLDHVEFDDEDDG